MSNDNTLEHKPQKKNHAKDPCICIQLRISPKKKWTTVSFCQGLSPQKNPLKSVYSFLSYLVHRQMLIKTTTSLTEVKITQIKHTPRDWRGPIKGFKLRNWWSIHLLKVDKITETISAAEKKQLHFKTEATLRLIKRGTAAKILACKRTNKD